MPHGFVKRGAYSSPFADRYSSKEMLYNFSPDKKFKTWRKLWIALAETQSNLGLPIAETAIRELRAKADDIDYDLADRYEAELKHDVMAHIKTYGDQCPRAKGVIHLGATSAYVVDNTDLILLRDGYKLVKQALSSVIGALAKAALKWTDEPTVAFTHFQAAQFTTVGKRMCLWISDLLIDLDELEFREKELRFLGVKGTTGTQASFLALFKGNDSKVEELDDTIARTMGFDSTYPISGQTYSRKVDAQAQATLAGIAESAHKFANDMRLLQHLDEVREPFGKKQVGSSAMAYKRNPMKAERITSLARFVISLSTNAAFTAASQWFERTLDDSAGKRIALPEAFLAVDAILHLYHSIATDFDVNVAVIRSNVNQELHLIASENIMMEAVLAGGDRQELHERIRVAAMDTSGPDTFLETLRIDPAFAAVKHLITPEIMNPKKYIGRSVSQVRGFLASYVAPRIQNDQTFESEVRV